MTGLKNEQNSFSTSLTYLPISFDGPFMCYVMQRRGGGGGGGGGGVGSLGCQISTKKRYECLHCSPTVLVSATRG